ncbi:ATP-dependent Clp protease ATP-binding subunit [Candidatus Roizmanbacteria bacterium]|nr:MAG: ATP-dependent Clp protease ATP-binding subunit [Candidatus Roizmanbacteria bacterium]
MKKKITHFFLATYNILLFLSHFFSVSFLLKSLFEPWKNVVEDEGPNASMKTWYDTQIFNVISRTLGFVLRSSLLIAYLVTTLLYALFLPIATLFFFLILPFTQLIALIPPSEETLKQSFHDDFMKKHANQSNAPDVEQWFSFYYDHYLLKKQWWSLKNLMTISPLGHDWSSGFTNHLNYYGTDIGMDDVNSVIIGREEELKNLANTISKTENANVILIGETGVGKQTIINSLAHSSYNGMLTETLNYRRFVELDIEKILAEYTDHDQRQKFFEELLAESDKAKNIILVINDIDRYVSTSEGSTNLLSSIEKFAVSSNVHCIATTEPHEYEQTIRPLTQFSELFTAIEVNEPSQNELHLIVAQQALKLESKFKVVIPYQTISDCVVKSEYYVSDLPFPEKALRLLEDACIIAQELGEKVVLKAQLERAITHETHAPTNIDDSMKVKLLDLEQLLQKQILNQNTAMTQLASALRRAFVMLGKRKKPLATLLFVGPTGTGKTATAKALTKILFAQENDSAEKLLRFDMSLYQSLTDIPQLLGTSDGKVQGLLTESVQEHPYATLLLDELEKAHHDLLNIFLTIFDEGYYMNGSGRRIDCKHLIIIATTNVERIDDVFSPEFINRFDGIVPFHSLDSINILSIARLISDEIINNYIQLHNIHINISDDFLKQIVTDHYDERYGARDVQRLISAAIEDTIAKKILENEIKSGDNVTL